MSYLVLARKYRPTSLSQVVGQDIAVQILTSALEKDRLGHALILTGTRGVGKTTLARILARALNCDKGPTANPCGVCPNCDSFSKDKHLDVIEMDAASHTGVDDIREIIESCRYRPAQGKYKIYIIDEVHMLSKSAFNALLKTLEEPASHVKFIFATTDLHKVPATILSRCLRLDLRAMTPDILEKHMAWVCEQENIAYEPEALSLIAKAAQGSVRDSLSLLDQAISLCDSKIQEESVREMLGFAPHSTIPSLFLLLKDGKISPALDMVRKLFQEGTTASSMLHDLMDHVYQETLKVIEKKTSENLVVLGLFWQMFLKGTEELQRSSFPQQAFEMLLIRICHLKDLASFQQQPEEEMSPLVKEILALFPGAKVQQKG